MKDNIVDLEITGLDANHYLEGEKLGGVVSYNTTYEATEIDVTAHGDTTKRSLAGIPEETATMTINLQPSNPLHQKLLTNKAKEYLHHKLVFKKEGLEGYTLDSFIKVSKRDLKIDSYDDVVKVDFEFILYDGIKESFE